MQNHDLPMELANEGDMMLQALLDDLLDLGLEEIVVTRDMRLPALNTKVTAIIAEKDIWNLWEKNIQEADVVILIAPEFDNILYRLTNIAERSECYLMGCSAASVALATNKLHTIERLSKHGITCVPTSSSRQTIPDSDTAWVIKPIDGVGGEGCHYIEARQDLQSFIEQLDAAREYIVQPYIAGIPASLSLFCCDRKAVILGYNRQLIEFEQGEAKLKGLVVNGLIQFRAELDELAAQIAVAIPGLWGYVGVDFIWTKQGPVIMEINPRLTTSYAGIHRSLQRNPVKWLFEMKQREQLPELHQVDYSPVTLKLHS